MASHPSRWLRPLQLHQEDRGGSAQRAPAFGVPVMGSDPAAEALQELGSEQGKGAVADACPTPRRVPPAQLPPGFALQTPQPRQQPPVKLRVVEPRVHLAPRMPHQPPRSTWGCLNSPARAAKGCFGWSWSRERQAPCILSKQLGKDTGAALGLERWRALL